MTLQHQWKAILFEAGYLATLGRKVNISSRNLNLILPALLPHTDITERLKCPWTVFSRNTSVIYGMSVNWGISHYQAVTLKSERSSGHSRGGEYRRHRLGTRFRGLRARSSL